MVWFTILLAAVALERLAELVVARRNEAWSRARGGREYGGAHYPVMVVLHTGLLVGALLEAGLADRPFLPWLGWPMFALGIAAQALRWWCIATRGRQGNPRIRVAPGLPGISSGPYRLLPPPNYVAAAVEGAALPLVHSAWITAVVFTIANAFLLRTRIA